VKVRSGAPHPHQLPTIGIGTGINQRLVDAGAARALAFAAEELGYSSVWTFDSPIGQRWEDLNTGRPVGEVLATLETFIVATSTIRVGAALLRAPWPLEDALVERLIADQEASGGRVAIARPRSSVVDAVSIGPTLQMWSSRDPELASWATGWMFDAWQHQLPDRQLAGQRDGLVVRLAVHGAAERVLAEVRSLRAVGASEIVLDVVADEGVDQALAVYSHIAEAVESDRALRTA